MLGAGGSMSIVRSGVLDNRKMRSVSSARVAAMFRSERIRVARTVRSRFCSCHSKNRLEICSNARAGSSSANEFSRACELLDNRRVRRRERYRGIIRWNNAELREGSLLRGSFPSQAILFA